MTFILQAFLICCLGCIAILLSQRKSMAPFIASFVLVGIMSFFGAYRIPDGKAQYLSDLPKEFIFIKGAVSLPGPGNAGRIWMYIRTKDSNLEPINVELPYTDELAGSVLIANQIVDELHSELPLRLREKVAPTPLPEQQPKVVPKGFKSTVFISSNEY